MSSNSTFMYRSRHIGLSFARELSSIEREHAQNLASHEKLEKSIRHSNGQESNNNPTPCSISFDHASNDQTGSTDHRNNIYSCQKRRQSIGGSSTSSLNQTISDQNDEYFDENTSSSSMPFRRRRLCSKIQRLPPVIKRSMSIPPKRPNKTDQWVTILEQSNTISKENLDESCSISNNEITKADSSELPPIEKQVRSFLEKLPKCTDVQHGFDSFASSSTYTQRRPIRIR